MRVLLAVVAAIGLAAVPCAWDDDSREAPSILVPLSLPQPLPSSAAPVPHRLADASAGVSTPRQ
ncbi:hypothetical protein [Azospirillum thiophilum]|uniref:hypothetical protein n=1 Tax=Azospirillum thiophilum TaxID=528244 RepID=UPI000A9D492F|nr:hypothetical protein [Azospirillum thiophilum]